VGILKNLMGRYIGFMKNKGTKNTTPKINLKKGGGTLGLLLL